MSDDLTDAMLDLIERLGELAKEDRILRQRIRSVARAIVDIADEPDEEEASEQTNRESSDSEEPVPFELPQRLYGNLGEDVEERIDHGEGALTKTFTVSSDELPLIVQRCRLKAEGARWAIEREKLLDEGKDFRTEIEPHDRAIIERAKELPDCFLWMNNPSVPIAADPRLLEDVAGCFDTVASILELLSTMMEQGDGDSEYFHRGLEILAEAQSALRASVERVDALPDKDQQRVFTWLRNATAERKIYIPRFMRADDKADPTEWREIAQRVEDHREYYGATRRRTRDRRSLLNRIQYHVQRVLTQPHGEHEHDWERVMEAVEELIEDGMPPSSPELRGLIVPVIDQIPEEQALSDSVKLVLREIDRFLSELPASSETAYAAVRTPEVAQAGALLEGKSVVMIGGSCRPSAKEAIERALNLEELIWIETTEHQSISEFEPYIAKPEVAMVLLAIRWSSHSYGDVKSFCDRYGKPLVRLPGGYNPNQVAAQILRQSSGQLNGGT